MVFGSLSQTKPSSDPQKEHPCERTHCLSPPEIEPAKIAKLYKTHACIAFTCLYNIIDNKYYDSLQDMTIDAVSSRKLKTVHFQARAFPTAFSFARALLLHDLCLSKRLQWSALGNQRGLLLWTTSSASRNWTDAAFLVLCKWTPRCDLLLLLSRPLLRKLFSSTPGSIILKAAYKVTPLS